MSCYKVDTEKAYYVCPCGADTYIKFEDLEIHNHSISFPVCSSCKSKRTVLCVNEITLDDQMTINESALSRNIINQTLFVRAAKSQNKDISYAIPDAIRLASEESIVEAPLNSKFKAHIKEKVSS